MQKIPNKNIVGFVLTLFACHPCPNGGEGEGDICYQAPTVRTLLDSEGRSIETNEMLLRDLDGVRGSDLVFFATQEALDTTTTSNTFHVLLRGGPAQGLVTNVINSPFFILDKVFVDTNNDQSLDLLVLGANSTSGEETIITTLTNRGGGQFLGDTQFVIPGFFVEVAAGDLNGDGLFDLVLGGGNPTNLNKVLLNDGLGGFEETLPLPSGNATTLDLFDLDNDGSLDILSMQLTQDQIQSAMNGGDGIFVLQQSLVTGVDPDKFFVIDFDADSDFDLVTINKGEKFFEFFENDSGGFFSSQEKFPSRSETRAGLVVDVNNDRLADLVDPAVITVLKKIDDGIFANKEEVLVSGLRVLTQSNGDFPRVRELETGLLTEASSVAVADVNQDGLADFICLDQEGSQLSFILSLP